MNLVDETQKKLQCEDLVSDLKYELHLMTKILEKTETKLKEEWECLKKTVLADSSHKKRMSFGKSEKEYSDILTHSFRFLNDQLSPLCVTKLCHSNYVSNKNLTINSI